MKVRRFSWKAHAKHKKREIQVWGLRQNGWWWFGISTHQEYGIFVGALQPSMSLAGLPELLVSRLLIRTATAPCKLMPHWPCWIHFPEIKCKLQKSSWPQQCSISFHSSVTFKAAIQSCIIRCSALGKWNRLDLGMRQCHHPKMCISEAKCTECISNYIAHM